MIAPSCGHAGTAVAGAPASRRAGSGRARAVGAIACPQAGPRSGRAVGSDRCRWRGGVQRLAVGHRFQCTLKAAMAGTDKIAKNLERFAQAVAAHDRENPTHTAYGIGLAHFDIERLGFEEGEGDPAWHHDPRRRQDDGQLQGALRRRARRGRGRAARPRRSRRWRRARSRRASPARPSRRRRAASTADGRGHRR